MRKCFLGHCHEYYSYPAAQILAQHTMPQVAAYNLHALIVCVKSFICFMLHKLFLFVVSLGVGFVASALQVPP